MRVSKPAKPKNEPSAGDATLAKALAPEDIRPGDYVTVLHVTSELPSFLWCGDAGIAPRDEPVRIRYVPDSGGLTLRVRSVCLPFVLVKLPWGDRHTLDVRRCRLARLDRRFAASAWKAFGKKRKQTEEALRRDCR